MPPPPAVYLACDSTSDIADWVVYWRSECYDAPGNLLGFCQQTALVQRRAVLRQTS